MYLADPQLEQKSYFTPFTKQNRADITSLLIHSNVGSGTSFEDSSPNKFTVTNTGLSGNLVTRSSSVVKFGSESLNFGSANTQYLEISDNDAFHFNTSDFTIEAWIYPLNFGNYRSIYHQGETSGNYYMNSVEVMSSGALRWLIRSQSTTVLSITTNASTLTANTWQHIAATREGNYFKLWINGVLSKTSGFISTALDNLTYDVHIGNRVIGGTPTHQYYGYMDEVRVTNGTALYTADFTPPAERLKNGAWLDISGNENNGNFINELSTGTSHYRVGDVIYPAGTNSARYLEFDGTDQYITIGHNTSFDNTTFSFSAWVYVDGNTTSDRKIVHLSRASEAGGRAVWQIRTSTTSNQLLYQTNNAGTWQTQEYNSFFSGAGWYHVCVTHVQGNAAKMYKNGSFVSVNTGSCTQNFSFGTDPLFIGTRNNGTPSSPSFIDFWDGKMAQIMLYSQELSAAEVLDNYNSTKSRFS